MNDTTLSHAQQDTGQEPPPKAPARKPRVPRKVGAPPGNENNLRHGLRTGSLPKKFQRVTAALNKFRRDLESAVLALRGEVREYDAACISTATRWEKVAQLAQRWLLAAKDLTADKQLEYARIAADASSKRDAALKALGLDEARANDTPADFYQRRLNGPAAASDASPEAVKDL